MLTQEQKIAIYEDYKDRSKTVREIAAKHGIAHIHVTRIAVEMGAEPRLAKSYGVKRKTHSPTERVCPKCRKAIDVKGARYCPFCGTDIRSKKELLIERIENAMPLIMNLPTNMRDDAQKLFSDVIKELKGGAE